MASVSMAPPAAKRPRRDEPAPRTFVVGRTEAVRFHKASRCWRVGRLRQVVCRNEAATGEGLSPQHAHYALQFDNGDTELLTERQMAKSVLLNHVSVGTRISVYWKESNCHYEATVTRLRETGREAWNVSYDFGEREWINLAKTSFTIVSQPEGFDETEIGDEPSLSVPCETMSWSEHDAKPCIDVKSYKSSLAACPNLCHRQAKSFSQQIAIAKSRSHVTKSATPVRRPAETVQSVAASYEPDNSKIEFRGLPDNIQDVEKGCRIALWWPGERFAVVGTVAAQRNDAFRLDYSRSHREWVDLRKYRFKILSTGDGNVIRHQEMDCDVETLQEPNSDTNVDRIVVGSEISIYWASIDAFRDCKVIDKKSDGRTKPYWLHYSDGEREWVNFDRMIWKFRSEPQLSDGDMFSAQLRSSAFTSPQLRPLVSSDDVGEAFYEKAEASTMIECAPSQILSTEQPLCELLQENFASGSREAESSLDAVTASPSPSSEACYDDADTSVREVVVENLDRIDTSTEIDSHEVKSERKPRGRPPKEKSIAQGKKARAKATIKEAPVNLRTDAVEEVVVASRIKIWQEADHSWAKAMVINIRLGFGSLTHHVEYESGDSTWLDLAGLIFRFLRGSKRKAEEVDDSSDEADMPEQEDNELEILPGSKIRIWDPSTTQHFLARMIRYRRDGRDDPYYIELESGEKEWTGFQYRSFRFCPGSRRCHSPIHNTKLYCFPDLQVGSRLYVWWDNQCRWFVATVAKIKPDRERPHFLEYDDGDKEWLDLRRRRFMVDTRPNKSAKKGMSPSKWKAKAKSNSENSDGFDSESGLEDSYSDNEQDLFKKPGSTKAAPLRNGAKSNCHASRRKLDASADDAPGYELERQSRPSRDVPVRGKQHSNPLPRKQTTTSGKPTARQVSDQSDIQQKPKSSKSEIGAGKKTKPNSRRFQEPTTAKEARELAASLQVGSRVSVWWDGEDRFFPGTITLVREGKRPFCLEYDDGDREWIDLVSERFRVL